MRRVFSPVPKPILTARQRRTISHLLGLPRGAHGVPGESLAAAARYSPSRLRALCRMLLGETPAARQRRRRLDAAACSLLGATRSIRRVAAEAGFRSNEAFHRAFMARFGCTPRSWARSGPPFQAPRVFAIGAGMARWFETGEELRHG